MARRGDREPPAPTPVDELISRNSLRSSPWILARIRELNLKGRLVKGWTPPVIAFAKCSEGRLQCVRN
jgi:hypothetical protein